MCTHEHKTKGDEAHSNSNEKKSEKTIGRQMNVPTTYHTTLKHPHQEHSGIGRLVLEVNARFQHLAREDLHALSGSTADG